MFEKRNEPLASTRKFLLRLIGSVGVGILIIAVALYIGMLGYHGYEHMSWIDAFLNAAMILSGMGPVVPLVTSGGKVFAGMYALFSGFLILVIIAVMFSPIIHRFFHKFHLDA